MKLIRKLGTRLDKNGTPVSWAVFWCDCCKLEVERILSNGKLSKSCGALKCKENKGNFKHGGKGTRLYNIWNDMKYRCLNTNAINYKDYGGRRITICPEWTGSYIVFRDWSLANGYADNLIIDRKNPDGNYEPNNCRFITVLESNRNKTNTITLEIANEIRALDKTGFYTWKELANKFNVSQQTISGIINNKIWRLLNND